ncbi:MAG: hypothetical protein ACOYWZ_00120 [Bacillota bacterium]
MKIVRIYGRLTREKKKESNDIFLVAIPAQAIRLFNAKEGQRSYTFRGDLNFSTIPSSRVFGDGTISLKEFLETNLPERCYDMVGGKKKLIRKLTVEE